MDDHAEAAGRYRHQAEEFRTKSDVMRDGGARDSIFQMAAAYDAMAANEDKMAARAEQRMLDSQSAG